MDVRSVMTANPACCSRDTPLQQVARLMVDNDCGQIPVVDESGRPLGVITDRDIAVRAVASGTDPSSATAGEYMSAPAATLSQNASVADCVQMMERNKIRRVVVVDDSGTISGIVAQADIARSTGDSKTAEVVKQVSEPGR
jgi:CBS domain-containing protein